MIYYSESTSGFYNSLINGADIPHDACEISNDVYRSLMADQAVGKVIRVDGTGVPYTAFPEKTKEDLIRIALAKRNSLLLSSDWVILRSLETGNAISEQWLAYRLALRNIPTQPGFPEQINWPEAPDA